MAQDTPDAAPFDGWMTLKRAAEYLDKPQSWMYDNYKRLKIPHTYLRKQPRFHREQLDKWMFSRMEHRYNYSILG